MELDDLKYQLIDKLSTDHHGRSDADLAALLSKRTMSITGKLIKSLRFEIISCIVMTLLFITLAFASFIHPFRTYFGVFSVFSLFFMGLTIRLYRNVQKLSATALPVKSNLLKVVEIMELFTRLYFQVTMAMVPVTFCFALILGYNDRTNFSAGSRLLSGTWQVGLVAGLYVIALAVGVYYFTRWYLRKLYGKYVAELKECIGELEE